MTNVHDLGFLKRRDRTGRNAGWSDLVDVDGRVVAVVQTEVLEKGGWKNLRVRLVRLREG